MFPLKLFVPLCAELIQMLVSELYGNTSCLQHRDLLGSLTLTSKQNIQLNQSSSCFLFYFPWLLFSPFGHFLTCIFSPLFYPLLCLSWFFLVYLFLFSILSAVSFLICFSCSLFPLMLFFCFCCWFFLLFCLLLSSPFLFLSLFPLFFLPLYLLSFLSLFFLSFALMFSSLL